MTPGMSRSRPDGGLSLSLSNFQAALLSGVLVTIVDLHCSKRVSITSDLLRYTLDDTRSGEGSLDHLRCTCSEIYVDLVRLPHMGFLPLL